MDPKAYLKRHGWSGPGHSLDLSGQGIRKPLLFSKKIDVLGLGTNKHAAVADQWWMKAFDSGLKNFGTGKESTLDSVGKHGVNRGGLYGRFVKGEGVPGTFGEGVQGGGEGGNKMKRKRKRGEEGDGDVEEEGRTRGKGLSEAKMEGYRERAKRKGVTVEAYIRRREEKYREKKRRGGAPP